MISFNTLFHTDLCGRPNETKPFVQGANILTLKSCAQKSACPSLHELQGTLFL